MSEVATSTDADVVADATLDLLNKMERAEAFQLIKAQLERFRAIGAKEAFEEVQRFRRRTA